MAREMIQVINRYAVNPEFGVLEGLCADCGALVLFARDVFGDVTWLHKVTKENGFYGFEYFCPERKK